MSAEQTPGAPTEQEWAEAVGRAVKAWDCCATCTGGVFAPLIDREREAARAEGMAAAAGPVLALADRTASDAGWMDQFGDRWVLLDDLRAAIPTDTDALARVRAEAKAEALREAAEWVAEHVGYPIEAKMPDAPMPDALWDALVTHVHEDRAGRWHGRKLARDEVDFWLCSEVGHTVQQDGGDRG